MHLRIPPLATIIMAGLIIAVSSSSVQTLVVRFPLQLWVSGSLLLAATGIGMTCVLSFFLQRTTVNPMRPATSSALVTSGLYNVSRNPMYLAMILMLTALAFYLGALLPGLIVIGLTIYFLTEFQIKPEEEALEALFGEEYRAYKARVRRWI